jgi:eukaryotic-like serine/threonine-protein kinase
MSIEGEDSSADQQATSGAALPDERRRQLALRELLLGVIGEGSSEDEPASPAGARFGDYVLEKELGRGAFGIVHLARHAGIHRHVALKELRDGELATHAEIERFLQGAEAAAVLEHPNIVPVFHVSGQPELPFFTMRYVKGGNLAQALQQRSVGRAQAIGWVIQIARAVQHAHDRGLIHLDLKPANILLDESAVPYVTDFGLARSVDPAGHIGRSDVGGGAPYYMAPEQLSGDPNELTVRTDVYALGVILYELVTGAVPYAGLTLSGWKEALVSSQPVQSVRRVSPNLDPDLDAVCAKALAKQPENRYQSALALAEDLEHLQRGERDSLSFRAGSSGARLWRWVRRHRVRVGALLWGISLLTALVFRVRATQRAEQESLTRQEQANASMASVQAVAFRFQLLEYQHRIARLAQLAEVVAIAASPGVENPSQFLIERGRGFGTLYVMGTDGMQRARTTRMSDEYMQRSFSFRDYFRGARQLALRECASGFTQAPAERERSAYLARAHVSESDGQFEFAVAAPVCDAQGWVGLIGGTISSNKVFGAVRLADGQPGRIAALLGPRDMERRDIGRALPDGFTFIVHPGLTPGREYQLQRPDPAWIRAAFGNPAPTSDLRYVEPLLVSDYVDPVPNPDFSGPWSAALAPVDSSGFVVVVQSPRPRVPSLAVLCAQAAAELMAPFGVGLALLLALRVRQRVA